MLAADRFLLSAHHAGRTPVLRETRAGERDALLVMAGP
jgi:hypothetical protein